jgi:tRNA threonylcarbamoyladenosine biosynthesis protein TsaB
VIELALENSTEEGSLALAVETEPLWTATFRGSGQLALALAEARKRVRRFDRVIVGTGPGSYTGLRVAAATAFGLETAFGCELTGCPSIVGFAEADYAVAGNARRGTFFFARVRSGRVVEGPRLVPTEALAGLWAQQAGSPAFAVTALPEGLNAERRTPAARHLLGRPAAWTASVEPRYLKDPHVTFPAGRR